MDKSAEMLNLPERKLKIAEGEPADFTAFTIEEGKFTFTDADGNIKECEKKFVPHLVIIKDFIKQY